MSHIDLVPVELPIRLQCLLVPVRWRVEIVRRDDGIKGMAPWFIPERKERKWTDEEMEHFRDAVIAGTWKEPETSPAATYDAWEMRLKFFRLKPGDNEAAAEFLSGVGLFDKPILQDQLAALAMRPGSKRALIDQMLRMLRRSEYMRGIDGQHDVCPEDAHAFPAHLFWNFQQGMQGEMTRRLSPTLAEWTYGARFAALVRLGPSAVITALTFQDAIAASIRIDQLRAAKFKKCLNCGVPFAAVGPRKRKYCTWNCGHAVSVRLGRARERARRERARARARERARAKKGKSK